MSVSWLGCMVSIDCGDVLGTYQGCVALVDSKEQTLCISQAFRNGIPSQVPRITLNAGDIKNLKILKSPTEAKEMPELKHTLSNSSNNNPESAAVPANVRKSALHDQLNNRLYIGNNHSARNSRSLSPKRRKPESPTKNMKSGQNGKVQKYRNDMNDVNNYRHDKATRTGSPNCGSPRTDEITHRKRVNSVSEEWPAREIRKSASIPRKIDFQRRPREDCFSAPIDSFMGDFDFEKNLALFDKQAVFEEIENTGGNPLVVRPCEKKDTAKYKYDENVLKAAPTRYTQIKLPTKVDMEFVTDSGLVIPAVSYDLRSSLFCVAEQYGFNSERILEMAGRSAAEMVLQLLGGSHRLNPQNEHQCPSVAVLCGPHLAGAQAVNCARHLAVRGVQVTLFAQSFVKMLPELEQELQLFQLTQATRIANVKDLPDKPVDIIISALDGHQSKTLQHQSWFQQVVTWANQSKAPVLTVDPPTGGGAILTKWSLSICLPLNLGSNCGQVYLADLGFPPKLFQEVGIMYKSPFGHKFVIPLHEKT